VLIIRLRAKPSPPGRLRCPSTSDAFGDSSDRFDSNGSFDSFDSNGSFDSFDRFDRFDSNGSFDSCDSSGSCGLWFAFSALRSIAARATLFWRMPRGFLSRLISPSSSPNPVFSRRRDPGRDLESI
jgi:hypothetical protein